MKKAGPFIIVVLVFVTALFVNMRVCRLSEVSGDSMYPNYKNGDVVVVSLSKKEINRFDVVVFNDEETNKFLIKRVIGLPGEKVQIIDDYILVNDILIDDYVHVSMGTAGLAKDEIELGENEYFVLGDNRTNSKDSRMLGAINVDDMIGKAVYKIS